MGTVDAPPPPEGLTRAPDSRDHLPRPVPMVAPPLDLAVSYPMSGVCVVRVTGELDLVTGPVLDHYVGQQLGSGPVDLVIDLDAVEFLCSSGLTALLRCSQQMKKTYPVSTLHLTGTARRAIHRPLQLVGLLPLFDTHPTLNEALAHLRAAEAAGQEPRPEPLPPP